MAGRHDDVRPPLLLSMADFFCYDVQVVTMKIIRDIEKFKKIPPKERKFYYISDLVFAEIPIKDSGEGLLDIGALAKKNRLPLFLDIQNSTAGKMYLRETAAKKLLSAISILQKHSKGLLTLKIYETLRPISMQRKQFNDHTEFVKKKYGLSGKALWLKVTEYLADPDLHPPHATGGVMDLTIARVDTGHELNMGSHLNDSSSKMHTWYGRLPKIAKENRKLLYRVMTEAGFVNTPTEWWHYSYGDQFWAVWNGKKCALYDSVGTVL